jgi:hypothetical protein
MAGEGESTRARKEGEDTSTRGCRPRRRERVSSREVEDGGQPEDKNKWEMSEGKGAESASRDRSSQLLHMGTASLLPGPFERYIS